MLVNYLHQGILTIIYFIPITFITFCIYTGAKFLIRRKMEVNHLHMLCEFSWILTVLVILRITGIIGGNFSVTSMCDNLNYFNVGLFEEGLSIAMLFNVALFIPFGFFSPLIIKKLQFKWYYTLLLGLTFSLLIEFLQLFVGRFVQLDDVLMNTLGTLIGYEVWFLLSKLKFEPRQKK